MDVSIPRVPEAEEDTYAYSLSEIKTMLAHSRSLPGRLYSLRALPDSARASLRGLTWENFDGKEFNVTRSVWNSTVSEPKTRRSRSPIPVVKLLADALEAHRLRAGILAQPGLPIFQAGNGQPLNLDNLARRVIIPRSRAAPSAASQRPTISQRATFSGGMLPFPNGTHGTLSGAA